MSALAVDPPSPILVPLRDGAGEGCVFLFPGRSGEARELWALAAALTDPAPVVGVEATNACPAPLTVEAMASVALAAMRSRQPHGPYRLVGYSFGGLVAIEVARLCRESGESVALLALIDTIFARRHWPARISLAFQLNRLRIKLLKVWAPPAVVLRRFGERVKGLWTRSAGAASVDGLSHAAEIGKAAMAAYRPKPYAGEVCFLQSAQGEDFGFGTAALWRPLLPRLSLLAIPGRHLDLVRAPAMLVTLAAALDDALGARAPEPVADGTPRPKALLATSVSWLATSRLALALTEAGFEVAAVCPPGHSLGRVAPRGRLHAFRPLAARTALVAAIAREAPQIVIPCDDRVAAHLHGLARADPASPAVRTLIARSLGDADIFPLLYSRSAIMALAAEVGVRRPETARIDNRRDLSAWLEGHGYPAVLKTDGSWGGSGVAVVADAAEALRAFDRLRAPPGLPRVVKRLLVDGDANLVGPFLRRRPCVVNVQAFVPGPLANAAVACFEGEVLGAVFAEVVRSEDATGPATVVRVVEHPQMAEAVTRMVRRLRLSGLCGFDFVLGAQGASLIELNPRATPTCHLTTADGAHLPVNLLAALRGLAPPPADRRAGGGLVALFPQEMIRDGQSPFLTTARHDVPWRSPELVVEGLRMARRRRRLPRLSLRGAPDPARTAKV